MTNFEKKIKAYIQKSGLLQTGDTLLVGVSGGPDSVCLIHLLSKFRHELGLQLHIAHYNHGLRKNSLQDQRLVEQLASSLHLPCHSERWKHKPPIRKMPSEDLARKKRFDFFVRVAKKEGTKKIALAHTKSDLAETVLMRILRGTGVQGLRGILPKRTMQNVILIRPLLCVTKDEIRNYLKKYGIAFCLDPTNQQLKYFRNNVRLKLIPFLQKTYNPHIEDLLCNLSYNTSTDYDYLEHQTQNSFKRLAKSSNNNTQVTFGLNTFTAQHLALQRMLMRKAIEHLKGDTNQLTFTHTQEIEDLIHNRPSGSIVHLPNRLHIQKKHNKLLFCK